MKKNTALNWGIYLLLCLIWGSSFILMKLGLFGTDGTPVLSAYQVAALRMLSAGLALLPFLWHSLRPWPGEKAFRFIILSGLLGSFFPAFLFCLAETRIDSALAGMLNAMTPLATLLVSVLVYNSRVPAGKWMGIILGLVGCMLLFVSKRSESTGFHFYAAFALIATICYGFNVNMVKHKLAGISSIQIATLSFVFLMPFSLGILWFTGFFQLPLMQPVYITSIAASAALGIGGTALATILFYVLMRRAGILFGSMVTYGIPFVALGWGLVFGEPVSLAQVISLLVILAGVYAANSDMVAGLLKKIPGPGPGQ